MDYAEYEIRWWCVESLCALWLLSGMHSKVTLLKGCISHEKFCNLFNLKFERSVPSNHHHTPDVRKAAKPKNKLKEHILEHVYDIIPKKWF